jgi:hypothetical protein
MGDLLKQTAFCKETVVIKQNRYILDNDLPKWHTSCKMICQNDTIPSFFNEKAGKA